MDTETEKKNFWHKCYGQKNEKIGTTQYREEKVKKEREELKQRSEKRNGNEEKQKRKSNKKEGGGSKRWEGD